MELNVNNGGSTITEVLGINTERSKELWDLLLAYFKPIVSKGEDLDKPPLYQYCATVSSNLEEYTYLISIIQNAIEAAVEIVRVEQREEHEKTCPHCKAKREAREKREKLDGLYEERRKIIEEEIEKMEGDGVKMKIEHIAPGVIIVSL